MRIKYARKLLSLFIWLLYVHLQGSGISDREPGDKLPPGQLNVKTRSLLSDCLLLITLLVFNKLFFCIFQGIFVFLASVYIHYIQIHYHF